MAAEAVDRRGEVTEGEPAEKGMTLRKRTAGDTVIDSEAPRARVTGGVLRRWVLLLMELVKALLLALSILLKLLVLLMGFVSA